MEIGKQKPFEIASRIISLPLELGKSALRFLNPLSSNVSLADRLEQETQLEYREVRSQLDDLEIKGVANITAEELLGRMRRGEAYGTQLDSLRKIVANLPAHITINDLWLKQPQIEALWPYISDIIDQE